MRVRRMVMFGWICFFMFALSALIGCGGGNNPSGDSVTVQSPSSDIPSSVRTVLDKLESADTESLDSEADSIDAESLEEALWGSDMPEEGRAAECKKGSKCPPLVTQVNELIEAVKDLPKSAFKNKNAEKVILNRLKVIRLAIKFGKYDLASMLVDHLIINAVDGCEGDPGGTSDKNDKISDCTYQVEIQELALLLIEHLKHGCLQSIVISPASADLLVDETQQFTAECTYGDDETWDCTLNVLWDSSDTVVASIDSAGLITALSEGTTNVTAGIWGMTSDAAAVNVSVCVEPWVGMTIDKNTTLCTGVYDMFAAGGFAIKFDADDISLDCNGSTLNGDWSGVGVLAENRSGISIEGCTMFKYGDHILLDGVSGATVTGNAMERNGGSSISLVNSSGNTITNNSAVYGGPGISLDSSDSNVISGNTSSTTSEGILIENSSDNEVIGNTVSGTANGGIILTASDLNRISGNNISDNQKNGGIYLVGSSGNTLSANTLVDANIAGIWLIDDCFDNVIIENNVDNSSWAGILISAGGTGNSISENVVVNTGSTATGTGRKAGIYLHTTEYADVANNTIGNSSINGIRLYSASYNTIRENQISASEKEGIVIHEAPDDTVNNPLGKISTGNVVKDNTITGSGKEGIYIGKGYDPGNDNWIFHNSISDSGAGYYDAVDFGMNFWDGGSELCGGNYYAQYDTSAEGCDDVDSDGYCDDPYLISGGANVDNYPFVVPVSAIAPAGCPVSP